MKFTFLTKIFLYATQKKCSKIQLFEDFEGFPPAPLNCTNTAWDFNVVTTRGIGDLYNCLIIIKRLIHAAAKDKNSVSTKFLELVGVKNDHLFAKILFLSPILLYTLMKMVRSNKGGAAVVLPFLENERQITIRLDASKERKNVDPLISHEHIHLLQHRNSEKHSKNIKCPELLFSDKDKDDKYLLYLMEKDEIEARLHEIVISYYRIKRELPLEIEGFLELLSGSDQCGWLVVEALASRGIDTKNDLIKYRERDIMFANNVANILVRIENLDLRYRFIAEVLAVMYGNLINYYGDEKSSRKYMSVIERPNLYDMLYI